MHSQDLPATTRARALARLLDSAFRVPGTRFRFGIDPILGLVPGVGDAVGGAFAFYLLLSAFRAGAPPIVLLRMFLNVAADVLLGSVPLIGDLLDAGYRANVRNLELLERYVAEPKRATKRTRWLFVLLSLALVAILAGAVALTLAGVDALADAIAGR